MSESNSSNNPVTPISWPYFSYFSCFKNKNGEYPEIRIRNSSDSAGKKCPESGKNRFEDEKIQFPTFEIDPEMGKSNSVEIRWKIIKNLQSEPDIGDFVPVLNRIQILLLLRNGLHVMGFRICEQKRKLKK